MHECLWELVSWPNSGIKNPVLPSKPSQTQLAHWLRVVLCTFADSPVVKRGPWTETMHWLQWWWLSLIQWCHKQRLCVHLRLRTRHVIKKTREMNEITRQLNEKITESVEKPVPAGLPNRFWASREQLQHFRCTPRHCNPQIKWIKLKFHFAPRI